MSDRVFIVGAGRVGRGLARAFRASGVVSVIGLHARRPTDDATSSGVYPAVLTNANVILVAVRDAEIEEVCRTLLVAEPHDTGGGGAESQGRAQLAHGTVILHTSGVVDPLAYDVLRTRGMSTGTFHPLSYRSRHQSRVPSSCRMHGSESMEIQTRVLQRDG